MKFWPIEDDRTRFWVCLIFGLPVFLVLSPVLMVTFYIDVVRENYRAWRGGK